MNILGISSFYHDSAACLVRDGEIIAAAQEERFTRIKHDADFPKNSIASCLEEAGLTSGRELDLVAFYEKPFTKFDRILSTSLALAPRGLPPFLKATPAWMKQKLWIKEIIRRELHFEGRILFPEHHESHAASAFFPSPFDEAAVLTIDGVGEWTTTSLGQGEGNRIELLSELRFPHSLGLLYSAFTYYLGFRVNSGEYKVMGLAPYGEPRFRDLILSEVIDLKPDGSLRLNLKYFNFLTGLTMTNRRFAAIFEGPRRPPEAPLTQRHMDIARSLQVVVEEAMLRMARRAQALTGSRNLCLAGGVALNCVGNGRILREGPFEKIWIQPAAGDAGGALGAALLAWHQYEGQPRAVAAHDADRQRGSFLGPRYDPREFLRSRKIPATELPNDELIGRIAGLLAEGHVIGWYQDRMEFGPRALGNRSILADPRRATMQETLNLKIKFRESFRPFAPAVLRERVNDFFELDQPSPYMLLVAPVKSSLRTSAAPQSTNGDFIERLKAPRSTIPAVTHVDYSARVQTVAEKDNPRFHQLLAEFERRTGCPVLVNTSFNVRGEPPVCTPADAYRCFMRTGMDYLVLGDFLVEKGGQSELAEAAGIDGDARAASVADGGLPSRAMPSSGWWINAEYGKLDRSPPALRRFGVTIGGALLLLTLLLALGGRPVSWIVGAAGSGLLLAAVFAPKWVGPTHRVWLSFSIVLGAIVTPVVLTIFFFLVVTPVGLLQRLFGKRNVDLRFPTDAASHWLARTPPDLPGDYEKQY